MQQYGNYSKYMGSSGQQSPSKTALSAQAQNESSVGLADTQASSGADKNQSSGDYSKYMQQYGDYSKYMSGGGSSAGGQSGGQGFDYSKYMSGGGGSSAGGQSGGQGFDYSQYMSGGGSSAGGQSGGQGFDYSQYMGSSGSGSGPNSTAASDLAEVPPARPSVWGRLDSKGPWPLLTMAVAGMSLPVAAAFVHRSWKARSVAAEEPTWRLLPDDLA
jgi:hypothetical protein